MPDIVLEQALYLRATGQAPRLRARSPGFADGWLADVERILHDFGERPGGVRCPHAVFAQPMVQDWVAVVQVADQAGEHQDPALGFHVVVVPRKEYGELLGEPFALADRFAPPWSHAGGELPALALPGEPVPPRTVADVQQVLKRVKAAALREDEDPETVELTVENAESPALLGGVQVLVDGGKVVFVRPEPDPQLVRGLWTLLPHGSRRELWPATFAFGNALGFDAVVVPRRGDDDYAGYTSEEQAADYPAGQYELALQTAAESGDQRTLNELFGRRGSRETLRLAILMALVLSLVVLLLRWFPVPEPAPPPPPPVVWAPELRERAAAGAAAAGSGDPWAAVGWIEFTKYRRGERAATAAGIVAGGDPWTAAVQARAAYARYVEIWQPVAGK